MFSACWLQWPTESKLPAFWQILRVSLFTVYSADTPLVIGSAHAASAADSALAISHPLHIFGLSASAKCCALVQSKDASGDVSAPDKFSFMTGR